MEKTAPPVPGFARVQTLLSAVEMHDDDGEQLYAFAETVDADPKRKTGPLSCALLEDGFQPEEVVSLMLGVSSELCRTAQLAAREARS